MSSNNRLSSVFFTVLAFLLILPSASFGQNFDYTEEELQQKFLKFLDREMDIEGWVDSDGDVQFEYDDKTYFIEVNESDAQFFRLVLFNIWPIESLSEQAQVLAAVDEVNRQQKVVKAYTTNDNVWIAMEVFLSDIDGYEAFLERGLEVIEGAVQVFVGEM